MEIVPACEADLSSILQLQKACYLEEAKIYDDYTIVPLQQTLESIQDDFLNQVFLKAMEGETLIGSVRAFEKDDTCYIGRLIVEKDFQNRGIGKTLMHKIENRFERAGRFELFTGFRSTKNLLLYTKLGYSEFKRATVHEKLQMIFLEKRRFSVSKL